MRAHDLNRARRLGTEHGHAAHAPHLTPLPFNQEPLRRRYWQARERAQAEGTIFVWNELQIGPARLYAHIYRPKARIVVSDDPTIVTNESRGVVRYV